MVEINFEPRIYLEISADKMKMNNDLFLPLSKQAISILMDIEKFKSSSKIYFSFSHNKFKINK